MAERPTVAISVFAGGYDAQVFARESICLDTARDLVRVVGDVSIHVSADDGSTWQWAGQVRSEVKETKE